MSPRALTTTGRQACLNPAHESHEPGARAGAAATGGGWSKGMLQARKDAGDRVGAQATKCAQAPQAPQAHKRPVHLGWARVAQGPGRSLMPSCRAASLCTLLQRPDCPAAVQYNTFMESGQSAASGSVRRSGTECADCQACVVQRHSSRTNRQMLKGRGIRSQPAVPHPRRPKGVNSGGGLRVQALQVEGCQQGQGAAQAVACERQALVAPHRHTHVSLQVCTSSSPVMHGCSRQ
jgi:hypothetical protein